MSDFKKQLDIHRNPIQLIMNGHFTLESRLYNEVNMFMYSNLIKHWNSCLTYPLLLNEPQMRDQIRLQI